MIMIGDVIFHVWYIRLVNGCQQRMKPKRLGTLRQKCQRVHRQTSCLRPTSHCITRFAKILFSSPELKAQVSFSDHLSSVVCLSVRLPSVCLSVNFSHFHLLLQNHWAVFNQTWHKVSLGEGDSSLFK